MAVVKNDDVVSNWGKGVGMEATTAQGDLKEERSAKQQAPQAYLQEMRNGGIERRVRAAECGVS